MFTEQDVVSIHLYTPSIDCIAYIVVFVFCFVYHLRVYCHRIALGV